MPYRQKPLLSGVSSTSKTKRQFNRGIRCLTERLEPRVLLADTFSLIQSEESPLLIERLGTLLLLANSPAAPPSVDPGMLIQENFTHGSENFSVIDGTWGVVDGTYQITLANTARTDHLNNRSVHNTVIDGDFVLDVEASVVANVAPWSDIAVIFGYQDPDNYYFYSSNESNDALTSGIFRVYDGQSVELVDIPVAIVPGVTYQLRVERVGSEIHAYQDGMRLATADDSTFTSGQVGFGTKNDLATFDNLLVSGAAVAETIPDGPTGLVAEVLSGSQVDLNWIDNSDDEHGFRVGMSSNGGMNWSTVDTVSADVTSYTLSDLTPATEYMFYVVAFNGAGESPWSDTVVVTTESETPPSQNDFTAIDGTWEFSDGTARIVAANISPTTHLNNRAVHGAEWVGDFTFEVSASVVANVASWSDFALIFGFQDSDNYYFFSSNESNDELTSGIFRVENGVSTELEDIPVPIVPGVTYQLRVERAHSKIRVYRDGVLLAKTRDSTFMRGLVGFGTKNDLATFDNLVVTGTVAPQTIPDAPSDLVAQAVSSSRIDLSWTDNSDNEQGFAIESRVSESEWAQIKTVGANVRTFSVTGLSAATTYDFRVRAFNTAGHSAYATPVTETTQEAREVRDERPGPHNTGLTNPDILVASGSITVTKDGTVLENLHVKGRITIQANNVTIRNVLVDGMMTNTYCIKVFPSFTGTLIEDSELIGATHAGLVGRYGIARRLNIHHMGADGVNPYGNSTLEHSWIHHLGMRDGSHADGVQVRGVTNPVYNVIIRYNYFDMPRGPGGGPTYEEDGQKYRSNTCIYLEEAGARIIGAVIEGNWLNGGNYTIHLAGTTDTQIVNNRFGRDYQYGLLRTGNSTNVVLSGNVWDDTGEPALK